jgi:ADP-ribose pyrophosphatase YjhB (NUDIX family)
VVGARYCPRCATALPAAPPTTCDGCGYELYVNPRPTGGVVVIEGDRFLALRRAAEPQVGQWELPGGFCHGWEHPIDAAAREAREELGVDVELGGFLGMYLGRYEYQNESLPVLDCFWLARLLGGTVTIDPLESLEYSWLPLINPPKLAFASMDQAIRAASISSSPGV